MIPSEHFSKYFRNITNNVDSTVIEIDYSSTRENIINHWVEWGFLVIVDSKTYYPDKTNTEYKKKLVFVTITELGSAVLEFEKL